MKILVVDDDFISRNTLNQLLSRYGECDIATTGAEALEACQLAHDSGTPYDIITMDIMMPEMDGIETLSRIRADEASRGIPFGNGAKVIMVTAMSAPAEVMASFREGCEVYLVKPVEVKKLESAIHRLGFSL